MRVMVVVGTRPQFIKASLLMEAFRELQVDTVLVHTGQHYDSRMSGDFFKELSIQAPDHNLGVGPGTYRHQIGVGTRRLVEVVHREKPDRILTIGDSNPALVGSLAATVKGVELAHSEAGLRSGNIREPEERNRILIDSLSDYLFCSTQTCCDNLKTEAVAGASVLSGDLLLDAWRRYEPLVGTVRPVGMIAHPNTDYCLFTLHRRSNAYDPVRLNHIVSLLLEDWPIATVWPVHPGVRKELESLNLWRSLKAKSDFHLLTPATYLEMRWLEENCAVVVTDSVGVQVEAYLARKLCLVLRHELEYKELESMGWSIRVKPDRVGLRQCAKLVADIDKHIPAKYDELLFGDGNAALIMAEALVSG